jgi:hypothetical protein
MNMVGARTRKCCPIDRTPRFRRDFSRATLTLLVGSRVQDRVRRPAQSQSRDITNFIMAPMDTREHPWIRPGLGFCSLRARVFDHLSFPPVVVFPLNQVFSIRTRHGSPLHETSDTREGLTLRLSFLCPSISIRIIDRDISRLSTHVEHSYVSAMLNCSWTEARPFVRL